MKGSQITGYIPEMPKIKTCDYGFTDLCKAKTTTCGDMNECTKEIIETSNKNNGNPDPQNFDYDKEIIVSSSSNKDKKKSRPIASYIPSAFCFFGVLVGIAYEVLMRKTHDLDEEIAVTTEKRNQFNHVVYSNTRNTTVKSYLLERRIGIVVLGVFGIFLFFFLG